MQVVTERVRKFKEFCEDRIEEKNFGPKEFEKGSFYIYFFKGRVSYPR